MCSLCVAVFSLRCGGVEGWVGVICVFLRVCICVCVCSANAESERSSGLCVVSAGSLIFA